MYRSRAGHAGRRGPRSEGLFCNYQHRICMQDRYEGFEFCLDHILEDKSAPFKQCNFVSTKTGQKCQKAAPKADRREGYCPAHSRKAAQMRHKAALKAKPTDAVKDTLEDLDYYRPKSTKSVPDVPPSLATKILDYGSESESEGDPLLLEQAWRGTTDSDAESVDSEQEDALRCAGVYTAEEAALITKDKLIRLQSLYINQFKRLQHVMREKRRSYLEALAKEREAFGIDFGVITDPKQKRKFREYQSARGFRRRKGKEALLYTKSKQRRIQATQDYQGKQKVPLMLQCCHNPEDGVQCKNFSLPMAKFCKNHILHDPKQMLYKECARGEGHCVQPASHLSQDDSCSLHTGLPDHVTYKPYEPEPPPPPPKPAARPRPRPTIIPLPEAMLPPAPILPSQLDSQIDQLLQFQPLFLEQQLQQHVYDASRCMGAFAPPDMDVQVEGEAGTSRRKPQGPRGKGDDFEPTDTGDGMSAGAAQSQMRPGAPEKKLELPGKKMDAAEDVPMETTSAEDQKRRVREDSQTEVHIDVETDVDVADVPSVIKQSDETQGFVPSGLKKDVDMEREICVIHDSSSSSSSDTEDESTWQQEPEAPMEVDSAPNSGTVSKQAKSVDVDVEEKDVEVSNAETSSFADVAEGTSNASSPLAVAKSCPAKESTDVAEAATLTDVAEAATLTDVADAATVAGVISEAATSAKATSADGVTDNSDRVAQKPAFPEQKAEDTCEAKSTKAASEGERQTEIGSQGAGPETGGTGHEGRILSSEDGQPGDEKSLPKSSSSPSEQMTSHKTTGDHTYNQAPLETEENGEQDIDVT